MSAVELKVGETADVDYTVTVTPTSTDKNILVSGSITVNNPWHVPAAITVADSLPDAVINDCPTSIAAKSTVTCNYTAELSNVKDGMNRATVTANFGKADRVVTTEASYTFDEPANESDETVTVTDSRLPDWSKEFFAADGEMTHEYKLKVGPYDKAGTYPFDNTASYLTNDTGKTDSHDATVTVTVPEPPVVDPGDGGDDNDDPVVTIPGCTLTQGYWKNHAKQGNAKYDATWDLIKPNGDYSPFFGSGMDYYAVLKESVVGNQYLNLAEQYIAAKLNTLKGAGASQEVTNAIADAEVIFQRATGTTLSSDADVEAAKKYNTLLTDYNEGNIAPGHCPKS